MKVGTVFKIHRKLSKAVLALCLIWILSGFTHPIMSWVRPGVKNFMTPNVELSSEQVIEAKEVITKNKLQKVENIRLFSWRGKDTYQIKTDNQNRYFNAKSGDEFKNGDSEYAITLARHFGGEKGKAVSLGLITEFNYKYPFVNRLLPVQKVHFPDSGKIYYIHTSSGRLGTVGNNLKDGLSLFFKLFHTLSFLNSMPIIKFIVVTAGMALIAFSTVLGLFLFFKMKKKRTGMASWHTWAGLAISLPIFMLTFSGFFHIAVKTINSKDSSMSDASFLKLDMGNNFSDLSKDAIEISVAELSNKEYLRVKTQLGKQNKINYYSANEEMNEIEFAKSLAAQKMRMNTEDIKDISMITRFGGEYGFVNKRLPVWKVTFNNSPLRCYVETSSQKVALKVTPLKSAEGFSFAYLHKAHFLDFLGKNGRNVILMLVCIVIGFTAITGVILKHRKSSKKSISN